MAGKDDVSNLDNLKTPGLFEYSRDLYTSRNRLPFLGAILEITPIPEEDLFFPTQIAHTLGFQAKNGGIGTLTNELSRAQANLMIRRLTTDDTAFKINLGKTYGTVNFVRTNSLKWDTIRYTIAKAKEELGI